MADLDEAMQNGQTYTFHFVSGGILDIMPGMGGIQNTVAQDANFQGPVAFAEGSGDLGITFVYAGRGSTVGNAGKEMQAILNGFWLSGFGTNFRFSGADAGDTIPTPSPSDTIGNPLKDLLPSGSNVKWIVAGIVVIVVGLVVFKGEELFR